MKKIVMSSLIVVLGFMLNITSFALTSERGANNLNSVSDTPVKRKVLSKDGGFEKSYEIQPPLISHKTDKYKVNLKNNGCLDCHSEKTYEREKAPKVSDSHFQDIRHNKKLKSISTTRYFCMQCHTVQTNAKELVKNTF